jgi:hypothetical protein
MFLSFDDTVQGLLRVRRLRVRNDWAAERTADRALHELPATQLDNALMTHDPAMPSYDVRRTIGCADWSNVCWLLPLPYGGCLNSHERRG